MAGDAMVEAVLDTSILDHPPDILVVDDTPLNLQLLMQMLKHSGYVVRPAISGAEALAAVDEKLPDLILLDIMMAGMSGYEVADTLKSKPETQEIPIIFVSALADVKSKVKAFTAGGVDYVTKPLRVEEVLARVETHLKLRQLTRQLQQELASKEVLIMELDQANNRLAAEIAERKAAQDLLQQTLSRTEALYEIARSLFGQENFFSMLQVVAEGITRALPADYARITTVDQKKQQLEHYVHRAKMTDQELPPTYDEFMEGLSGWVIRNVQPVISPQGFSDPRESPASRERRAKAGYGAKVVLPLYYMGKVLGTLTAANYTGKPDFDRRDLVMLSALATQVAVALNNAQLTAETSELKIFNEGIVQGVAEAILITNADGVITFANPAAASMMDIEIGRLIGQNINTLVADTSELHMLSDTSVCDIEVCRRYETDLRSTSGSSIPVLASTSALLRDGEFTGSLTALTDITELKNAEAALRQYADDLEARNAELDAFAHTVAHDLKNPLTALSGFSSLMLEQGERINANAALRNIQYIAKSAEMMNNIIDELLLLASVRKMEEVPMGVLEMPSIIKDARHRLAFLIADAHASVSVATDWPKAYGYGPWVTEVWVNYISNGVKYGGDPSVHVPAFIEIGWDEIDDDYYRFWVKDNGSGLSKEEQDQLFTPFERLHNVRIEGHGLGLSIVKRIVEKLDGHVGVESTLGEGSCFYFTLPRYRS